MWGDASTAKCFLCEDCFYRIWDEIWASEKPCARCETFPCQRGRDCWFEPNLPFPYETFLAPRKPDGAQSFMG